MCCSKSLGDLTLGLEEFRVLEADIEIDIYYKLFK